MLQKLVCSALTAAVLAGAAPVPGAVTAAGSITLNGVAVPPTGAKSAPLNLGDEVTTGDSAAVIRLDEYDAVITVGEHSAVKTGVTDGKPFVRLTEGRLHYQFGGPSKLAIYKKDQPVKTNLTGVVVIGGHGKTIAVVTGAGAGGTITAVGLAKRSKTCPNGQLKDKDCGNQ